MIKKIFIFVISSFLFIPSASATNNITDATGNIFLAPLRYQESNTKNEDWENMPCGASLITTTIAVSAAHCVMHVGPNSGFKSGEIWVQEPGKSKSDSTSNRSKVINIIYPKDLTKNPWNVPYHDIAFLILSKPLVKNVGFEVASLEEVKSLITDNSEMYGYGHFFGNLSEGEAWRASSSKFPHLNPRKGTVKVFQDVPHKGDIWLGLPHSIHYKVPPCRGNHGSGTPITAIINGKEKLVGIEGSSSGWSCDNDPYRNIVRAMIVASYLDLIKDFLVDEKKDTEISTTINENPIIKKVEEKNKKIYFTCINNKTSKKITSYRYNVKNIKCPKGHSLVK